VSTVDSVCDSLHLAGVAGRIASWAADDVRLRDLPWRSTRDPWAVVVSEVMLQQTQVARVLPKYEALLRRFPTVESCAAASAGEVIALWDGLGYNRRALGLHRFARAVVERFAGRVPSGLADLLSLPGIGPYTARAVRAFAFELDAAVVDTNVARVVARAVAGRPLRSVEVQAVADALLPSGDAWRWNQAMLDLGATVCGKRSMSCDACPVVDVCAWRNSGDPAVDPAIGSAGVSARQSKFVGSDRQGRGRLVRQLRSGPVRRSDVAAVMGWSDEGRASRVLAGIVADGLACLDDNGDDDGTVRLPGPAPE
jgi:A/G-specific adenine glycosylase